jgi:hypothetical protein
MENRERDKVSRNNQSSTDAGKVNRDVESRRDNTDSSADFGGNIGRSEELENEPSSRKRGSMESDIERGSGSSDRSGSSSGEH